MNDSNMTPLTVLKPKVSRKNKDEVPFWTKTYAAKFKSVAEKQLSANHIALEQFYLYSDYAEFQEKVLNDSNLSVAVKATIECLYSNIRSGNLRALEVFNQLAMQFSSVDGKKSVDGITQEEKARLEDNINRIRNEIQLSGRIDAPVKLRNIEDKTDDEIT